VRQQVAVSVPGVVDAEERFVASGALRIWTERVGDPGRPAVLMIMGSAAQGLSCPDALVGRLVERRVQVIRFDHRDTGRSSIVDFDAHPYTISDMARDCVAVLDGYQLDSAHVAGTSLGGMLAQWLGVHAPDRVRSLTVLSSSPMGHDPRPAWSRALAGEPADPDDLPPPSPKYLAHLAAELPPGVESDVALFRVFNGPVRPFDEPAARDMLERALSRATDPAAAANHGRAVWLEDPDLLAPLSSITAPTSVVHGDQDPIYPLAHGEALAAAIPGAVLHVVPGMGHVLTSPGLPEEVADRIRL
jgi:pimeloyl-ACP methyl ester carboxylesterase